VYDAQNVLLVSHEFLRDDDVYIPRFGLEIVLVKTRFLRVHRFLTCYECDKNSSSSTDANLSPLRHKSLPSSTVPPSNDRQEEDIPCFPIYKNRGGANTDPDGSPDYSEPCKQRVSSKRNSNYLTSLSSSHR